MNKKIIYFMGIISFIFLITACASKPGFKGEGDLCGLVIDENNAPVKDFVVYCKAAGLTGQIINPVKTNESGIFVFYDVKSGKYFLSGKKKNYLEIESLPYEFNDRTKILCLQTKTAKASFSKAEEMIRLGLPDEADKILKAICCEPGSKDALYVKAYRFFTSENQNQKEALVEDLKKSGDKTGNSSLFFKDFSANLEKALAQGDSKNPEEAIK